MVEILYQALLFIINRGWKYHLPVALVGSGLFYFLFLNRLVWYIILGIACGIKLNSPLVKIKAWWFLASVFDVFTDMIKDVMI